MKDYDLNGFALVSGRKNPDLVTHVAEQLEIEPIFISTGNWPNGYPRCVRPSDVTVNDRKVFIITSLQYNEIGSPVEELNLLCKACGSAREIHLIITWFCGKDDAEHSAGHVPNAPVLCNDISKFPGVKSIAIFDPHQSSHAGYFAPVRTRRFYFLRKLIERAREMGIDQVASTDFSSGKRALIVESFLQTGADVFMGIKGHDHNAQNSPIGHQSVHGSLQGKKIGLFDDMALTCGSMNGSAKILKEEYGAEEVHFFSAHFDPAGSAYENLKTALSSGWINSFNTTNSNPIAQKYLDLEGFQVVHVAGFVADVINSILAGHSTSKYFDDI